MRNCLFLILMLSGVIQAEPLFDLKVGSSWVYQVEGGSQSSVTNRISEARTVKGVKWYKLIEYGEIFWVRNTKYGQVEALNFFDRVPEELEDAEEVLIFKYPADIGEKWDNNGSPTTYKGVETMTVPLGTFECHMYFIDMGQGNYSKSCIALNIGVVYNASVLDGGQKEVSKIVKFDQKN